MAREIVTTGKRSGVLLVDDVDYAKFTDGWKWAVDVDGYAVGRRHRKDGVDEVVRASVFVMGRPPSGLVIDHINGNRLDNRKENLRLCTARENLRNRKKAVTKAMTSRWKGASWVERARLWRSHIAPERRVHLGYYRLEIDAAYAYNVAATMAFGDFAALNDIPPEAISPERRLEIESLVRAKLIAKGVIAA